MPSPQIPPPAAGMGINLIRGLGFLLPRKEYESAVILGRGLKGILKAGTDEWWRLFPILYRGRSITLERAGTQALFDVVTHCVGEVPRWLEDDLQEIRDFLREVGEI